MRGDQDKSIPDERVHASHEIDDPNITDRRTLALSAEVGLFIAMAALGVSLAEGLAVAWYWRLLAIVGIAVGGLVVLGYLAGPISRLVLRSLRSTNTTRERASVGTPVGGRQSVDRTLLLDWGRLRDVALYLVATAMFAGASYIVVEAFR